ncbi:nacht and ankyrin domain-containing protein [Cordyceps javanica]|uniref:Nacht and ankyrin domain-containing protein n=1 Tax=Cordyceps javanica TaxID=43265 RepID=A0A545UKJ6_9HYPO|nr:nacht and ankyrin domain-containing protein [Cordyceps javanica]
MPDPSIYNVGWICAIKPEYVAAQAFLDEKHERPDHVSTNDSNIYTLGRFGKHNVVIGTLPDGEYGIAAAVGVAKGMLSSFPNVRIGLMVGIGGGALSSKNDIRLGDIVVSAPRNGHGGVFQYDFGDTIQDKKFQTVGLLNQPPELIRAALTDIQAEYDMEGHQLEEVIDTALSQRPRLRKHYQRPSDSSDKLFKSGLVHRGIDGGDCATDCYDGPSSIVERQKRTSEEDNPVIHYGTIASANQLMKDALVRDRLAAEENVLCFEMEAAGLMNRFPCIVIRGICDYADSHKNKQWQGYAAMAAAAYAKDLLRRIPVTKLEAERQISVVLGSIDTNIKRIQSTATQLQSEIQGLHDSVLNARQKSVLDRLHVAEGNRPIVLVVDALDECEQEDDIKRFLYLVSRLETELPDRIRIFLTSRPEEPFRSQFQKVKRTNSRVILHEIPKPVVEHDIDILEGHNSSVESVAFSHDSALVAVGCYDYTVRIWRANTGERLQTLAGHSDPVWSVAFSHDSALLASGSDDSTRIWRADTGECIQTLAHHSGRVRSKAFAILSVAFSHDSALLASGCYDSTIRIWRAGTGKCMQTLAGHSGMVLSVAFSHNSTLLASGSSDSTVRIWRSSIGKCMQTLAGHSSEVQSVAFSHDSALVLSGSLDSTVRIWRASTGECMQTLAGHGRVVSMAFSHDSALVASGYYNSTVRIWRTSTGECLQTLAGHMRIWRAGTSQYIQTLAGHSVRVQSVAISHDSALVASGCYNSTVRIWRAGTGECLQTLAVHSGAAQSVAISHDSTLVASGCCDFIVRIWHTSTGECVQTLAGHSDVVLSVAFSHDSALIASGSYDCTVRIWRAGTGECVQTLAGHGLPVETVVFAHDSALVASGSRDATVRVWRADTGECVQTLAGHRGWVQSVALSHDSALVAAGSYDVRIWRADTALI